MTKVEQLKTIIEQEGNCIKPVPLLCIDCLAKKTCDMLLSGCLVDVPIEHVRALRKRAAEETLGTWYKLEQEFL